MRKPVADNEIYLAVGEIGVRTEAEAAALMLVVGGYLIGEQLEKRSYREERQQMSEDFGKLPTVTYDGKTYVRRPEVTTVLFIGVDQRAEEETTGYRSGGQSDFMLLLALERLPAFLVYPVFSTGTILLVLLLSALLFRERPGRRQLLGILLILGALVLLNV